MVSQLIPQEVTAVHGFVSHFTNKLDAKGRVSIPASFRSVLAKDGFEGLYTFRSPHVPALDAGGNALLNQIEEKLNSLPKLTIEYDMMATALYGASDIMKIDAEGRFLVNEDIRALTGITKQVTFVGQGYKFQIWDPERFEAHRAEAMKRALQSFSGPAAGGLPQ